MKNVVGYIRVSTDAQAQEDKYGIEAQKTAIMEYCAKNDMQISDWFIDEGESGVKESRPQLDRLLFGEISNPPVEAVIVYKSDRMARDIKLYFYYMMLLEKKGIELISATEPIVDDESGLGGVYKALMMFVASEERKNITKRTASGRAVKAAKGGYAGGRAPMGYKVEKGQLVIVPEEAEVVRFIFAQKEAGNTMLGTVRMLNEAGYKTRNDKEFVISTVQSIWNNELTYRGMYRYGKDGEWVQGEHEAILK